MLGGSVTKAMNRISVTQHRHTSGNTSPLRASSSAQVLRAARRWAGSVAGSAMGAGGAVVAPGASAVTASRSGELGASTPK